MGPKFYRLLAGRREIVILNICSFENDPAILENNVKL